MSVRTENYVNDGYQYGIVRDLAKGGTEVFYPAQNTLASAYSEYRSYRYHDKRHYEGRGNVRIERRPIGQWEPVPAEELAAPSAAGQHMQLVQAHVDPCSGSFLINEGKYGHGTWTETPDPDSEQD